jgi:hypothetical protein
MVRNPSPNTLHITRVIVSTHVVVPTPPVIPTRSTSSASRCLPIQTSLSRVCQCTFCYDVLLPFLRPFLLPLLLPFPLPFLMLPPLLSWYEMLRACRVACVSESVSSS